MGSTMHSWSASESSTAAQALVRCLQVHHIRCRSPSRSLDPASVRCTRRIRIHHGDVVRNCSSGGDGQRGGPDSFAGSAAGHRVIRWAQRRMNNYSRCGGDGVNRCGTNSRLLILHSVGLWSVWIMCCQCNFVQLDRMGFWLDWASRGRLVG